MPTPKKKPVKKKTIAQKLKERRAKMEKMLKAMEGK
jgi:hypothetical protein